MQLSIPYILYIHSVLRYLILLFAAITAFQCLVGMLGKKQFSKSNRIPALILLIFCDLQVVFGIILYYFKIVETGVLRSGMMMQDTYSRFYAVEHSLSMVVAIILVHMGYNVAKKNMDSDRKFKRLFWCSFIALALFMAMIPWEFKQVVGRPNIPAMPA